MTQRGSLTHDEDPAIPPGTRTNTHVEHITGRRPKPWLFVLGAALLALTVIAVMIMTGLSLS